MKKTLFTALALCVALPAAFDASAQAPARPQIETKKVDGTDNVYIFRNGGHQSMFVVTPEGVIATDPIGYGRPTGGQDYLNEIRKVTDKPVKYLVYSHHHFDHIAGGQAFKDAGARIVAHRNTLENLKKVQDPFTPLPDEVFDKNHTLRLGGTTLELSYLGPNHSDSTLVMRLPKDKLIFLVDTVPVGAFPGLGMVDFHPLEAPAFFKQLLAMDWDRMIPGHPGVPGDRLGTKKDVEEQMRIQQVASDTVKAEARAGKCWQPAENELQFPEFKDMPNYANGRPYVVRRYCGLWGRGT